MNRYQFFATASIMTMMAVAAASAAGQSLNVEVGGGGAVVDAPEPVDRTRLEQQRLTDRGLAAAAMADQGDVANPISRLVRHGASL